MSFDTPCLDWDPQSITHILFDLDGTIIASAPGIRAALAHAAQQLGIDVPLDDTHRYIGPPIEHFAHVELGLPDETATAFVQHFRSYYTAHGYLQTEPYPGIVALIRGLYEDGKQLYICTSKPEPMAIRVLEPLGIQDCFVGVVGAVEGRRKKIDVLAHAMQLHAIPPQQAVMIGDRDLDLLAAKASGTHSIGALYGYGHREELEAASPNAIAESVAHLARILRGRETT